MTIYHAVMPSNIALIKYMGKKNSQDNIPSNFSLSYTLEHLTTTVELKPIDAHHDSFHSSILENDSEAKNKFIRHLDFLRNKFGVTQYYDIFSENNFPADCGLASSASSFAALTACALKAFGANNLSKEEQAKLSQKGSGSSCRSFFSPFSLWNETGISEISLPYHNLIHHVIVVSKEKKVISSRKAHAQVETSLLFPGRNDRANKRLNALLESFKAKDWEKSFYIIWEEFWDMHALFETSHPPFGYLTSDSLFVLQTLRSYWEKNHDGPIVTMDAGPNVHLLFREDQKKLARDLKQFFEEKYLVL
jgi:diphosphomevalonate decarboxylase